MQNDIFSLLMMILMMENGCCDENINQMVIMFLMLQRRNSDGSGSALCAAHNCGRADGYNFSRDPHKKKRRHLDGAIRYNRQ